MLTERLRTAPGVSDVHNRSGVSDHFAGRVTQDIGPDLHPPVTPVTGTVPGLVLAVIGSSGNRHHEQRDHALEFVGVDVVEKTRAETGTDLESGQCRPGSVQVRPPALRIGSEHHLAEGVQRWRQAETTILTSTTCRSLTMVG